MTHITPFPELDDTASLLLGSKDTDGAQDQSDSMSLLSLDIVQVLDVDVEKTKQRRADYGKNL